MMDVDNESRAGWAHVAVDAFAAETRMDPREQQVNVMGPSDTDGKENAEEVMSDLLTDLHHLADVWGLDWEVLISRADLNHVEEVAEEAARNEEAGE